ncbi:uncharacterized protein MONBRDRAFT_29395 [Monosiga brevicollis MX1]|uniref:Membrane-associated protein n=1 Tax=Monosiga brevicollis TaxID=81824 RepID=A9VAZ0_MONBE|nr:uncharacterized protein MONBRDRAFT_29395 [Monosiga brevicollis MX1]EDQ85248.1 predicted protein [Monosiga brevicollis MX1]|eukprot:XP_001749869.1 hypothetical protein [Monosiga brevicollis MX1]
MRRGVWALSLALVGLVLVSLVVQQQRQQANWSVATDPWYRRAFAWSSSLVQQAEQTQQAQQAVQVELAQPAHSSAQRKNVATPITSAAATTHTTTAKPAPTTTASAAATVVPPTTVRTQRHTPPSARPQARLPEPTKHMAPPTASAPLPLPRRRTLPGMSRGDPMVPSTWRHQVELQSSYRKFALEDVDLPMTINFAATHRLFNPTFVVTPSAPDGMLELRLFARFLGNNGSNTFQRCPLYDLHSSTPCPRQDLNGMSFITTCRLDAELRCIESLSVLPYNLSWSFAHYPKWKIYGPEDQRSFVVGDRAFLTYNAPPRNPKPPPLDVRRIMKVQQVYPRLLEPVDLVYSGTTKTEKNWSPLRFDTKANEMLFSRFIEPHQVMGCQLQTGVCHEVATFESQHILADVKRAVKIESFHLATNTVPLSPTEHVGILHGRTSSFGYYVPLPYIVEVVPPFRVLGMARQKLRLPQESDSSRVYMHSLFQLNATHLILGYNVGDQEVIMTVLPTSTLTKHITRFA